MNKHLEAQRPLTAGLFDPPPEMTRDVLDWMLRTYCGHVLAQTDKKLAALSDILGPAKAALAEMYRGNKSIVDLGENLKEKLDYMPFGETVTIPLYRLKSDFTLEKSYVAVKCVEDAYFPEGATRAVSLDGLGVLPNMADEHAYMFAEGKRIKFEEHLFFAKRLKDVVYKVMYRLSDVIQRFEDALENAKDASTNEAGIADAVLNLRQMRSYCLNFTNQPKEYTATAKKVFALNLTGWRYVRPDEMHKLKGERGWDKVTCVLDFKGHNTRGGQWNVNLKELQVDVGYANPYAVESIQDGVAKIQQTLGHEMRHLGQDALKEIRGLKDEAGLPGKSIRTPGFSPGGYKLLNNKPWYSSGQRDHAVRDVEFYTRLSDEIYKFVRINYKYRTDPELWRKKADLWVKGELPESLSGKSGFFGTLRAREPLKWKKAVGEFYKAVEQKSFSTMTDKRAAAARVASRWMSAGIFAPPPAMVRAISDWMLELYCSDVLYETLLELQKYKGVPQESMSLAKKALAEMKGLHANVGRTLEQLGPDERVRFKTYSLLGNDPHIVIQDTEVKASANRYFDSHRKLQTGTQPDEGTKALVFMGGHSTPSEVTADVKKILEFAITDLTEEIAKRETSGKTDVNLYDELKRVQAVCLKYTSSPARYKNSVARKFSVDLTGWAYTRGIAPDELVQRLAAQNWTAIKCSLDFKGHLTRGGLWDPTKRELQVDSPLKLSSTVTALQTNLVKIRSTIEHEMRHVGQDILRDVLNLLEKAGLPSKSLRTLDPRKEHALLDSEFYTRLGDEVSLFIDHLQGLPDPQKVWSQMAHDWVDKKETFTKLKAKEPLKWKKAVAEFYKAVGNQVEKLRAQA